MNLVVPGHRSCTFQTEPHCTSELAVLFWDRCMTLSRPTKPSNNAPETGTGLAALSYWAGSKSRAVFAISAAFKANVRVARHSLLCLDGSTTHGDIASNQGHLPLVCLYLNGGKRCVCGTHVHHTACRESSCGWLWVLNKLTKITSSKRHLIELLEM